MGVLADLIALVNGNTEKTLDVLIQERATETNSKIDNRASQTSVDGIDTKIGATNNAGGTASAGSIFAKLNKLLTDWTTTRAGYLDTINTNVGTLLDGRVVKSVQRGFVENLGEQTYADVTINFNYINPLKSIVLLDFWYDHDYNRGPCIKQLNNTSMLIKHPGTTSFKCHISWQVIEFY